jgi:hypothetical protein
MIRRTGIALLAVAALAALPLLAQSGPGPHGRHDRRGEGPPAYDVAAEKTLSGTVAEVVPQSCPCGGIHLRLTTEGGDVEVGLGPVAYLTELGASFAAGDAVEVLGAAPKNDAPADFLARAITKGDATWELRDAEGAPKWAAQGMGCPMHRSGKAAS